MGDGLQGTRAALLRGVLPCRRWWVWHRKAACKELTPTPYHTISTYATLYSTPYTLCGGMPPPCMSGQVDRTFGFETAVQELQRPLLAAKVRHRYITK